MTAVMEDIILMWDDIICAFMSLPGSSLACPVKEGKEKGARVEGGIFKIEWSVVGG